MLKFFMRHDLELSEMLNAKLVFTWPKRRIHSIELLEINLLPPPKFRPKLIHFFFSSSYSTGDEKPFPEPSEVNNFFSGIH